MSWILMHLVKQIFDFAKSLAEMQLSETALALYSAYILLQDGETARINGSASCILNKAF